jgi:signal transduction histidine kinase
MVVKFKSAIEELSENLLFQKIGDICSAANTTTIPEDLLEFSLKSILELFGAKRGSIFILNDEEEHLILKASHGMKRFEEELMVKRMGEGIVGQVALFKKPIVVEDISTDKRFGEYKSRKDYLTPSFICAPLMIKDEVIGVVNITDKESGLRFNTKEVQLLDFLSSQIALNYRRILLYQKFKKVVKESEHLKNKLDQSDEVTEHLKKQIVIQEKLATIGKLAGGIAHEFNNPLDGVMRYTNLCLSHTKEDDLIRGYLLEIKHGLDRMAKIVKNLLDCSRSEVPKKERVLFKDVLEHVLHSIKVEILLKNIEVEKHVDDHIQPILDLGLERVLTNIIRNAIDAMPQKGKLSIDAKTKNNELVIKISDTGCGISQEIIDQIFEPFFTTKDLDKGCGLGLTIVSEIIKSYEGKIEVSSNLGEGATFTVTVPF